MVNQTVLEYIRKYSSQFKLEDIKKKVLSSGYSESDFKEAVDGLGIGKPKVAVQEMPKVLKVGEGLKWMKTAGISGIVLLAFSVLLIVLSFLNLGMGNSGMLLALAIALFVIIFASGIIFIFGFVKMGRYTNKILRFSSISIIISSTAIVVATVGAIAVSYQWVSDFILGASGITGAVVSSFSGVAFSPSLGDISIDFASFGAIGWSILVTLFLMGLYLFVVFVLFFIGLILAGKQVRFAKIAGLLGIIGVALAIGMAAYVFSNPFIVMNLYSLGAIDAFFLTFSIVLAVAGVLALVFGILSLFDASARFEK